MIKFAAEFHIISMVYMTPVIFLGMYGYNIKKIKENKLNKTELFLTCLLLSVLPIVNIAIGARSFMYLLMGFGKKDETK